ncbi:hypothetical protein H6F51_14130 [Cyanobacteria bacterium FACHB-DQ100]|uniref:hypothetical protein n=1 Tax=Leptolyngbya sp. DQ-M1 TaxID=2933920 RepID=UPI0019AB56D6|nr:hypothetical protein [Cyanobacteria bacterium FACHB-DQ100]
MQEQLEQRLKELKAEFTAGQKALSELESQKTHLTETLLRISGAIQVLEEELTKTMTTKNNQVLEMKSLEQ